MIRRTYFLPEDDQTPNFQRQQYLQVTVSNSVLLGVVVQQITHQALRQKVQMYTDRFWFHPMVHNLFGVVSFSFLSGFQCFHCFITRGHLSPVTLSSKHRSCTTHVKWYSWNIGNAMQSGQKYFITVRGRCVWTVYFNSNVEIGNAVTQVDLVIDLRFTALNYSDKFYLVDWTWCWNSISRWPRQWTWTLLCFCIRSVN